MFTWQLPLNTSEVPDDGKECQEIDSRQFQAWSKERGEEQPWRVGARCGLGQVVRGVYLGWSQTGWQSHEERPPAG